MILGTTLFGAVLVIIKSEPNPRTPTTTPAPQTVMVLMKRTVISQPNRPPAAARLSGPAEGCGLELKMWKKPAMLIKRTNQPKPTLELSLVVEGCLIKYIEKITKTTGSPIANLPNNNPAV